MLKKTDREREEQVLEMEQRKTGLRQQRSEALFGVGELGPVFLARVPEQKDRELEEQVPETEQLTTG